MDRQGLALRQRNLARHKTLAAAEDFAAGEVIMIVDEENPKIDQKRSILFLTAPRGY
jgi:hypothetical protein